MSDKPQSPFDPEFLESLDHETPFFIFSKDKITDNFSEFKRFFPNSLIQYAIKSNSEPEVLSILDEAGCGFELASAFELHMLQKLKIAPDRITYGTSVKSAGHIKDFFEYGVDRFACDSFSELEKIAANAPGSKVYIRVIANDSGSVFKFSEKFGTDITNVVSLLLRAKELGLQPYGISFHVGSQASDVEAWGNTVEALVAVFEELQDKGITLDVLNIGGGFPCQYASSEAVPTLEDISTSVLSACKKLPYQPKLMLEPGRGLIGNTSVVVATVIARVERKGGTWLFLDAGCYNALFETMAYQGSTRYSVSSMRSVGGSGESLFSLAGPTGDSQDVITREALLPQDIEVGEKLVFHNTGAYSLVVVSEFNGFKKPAVYYI